MCPVITMLLCYISVNVTSLAAGPQHVLAIGSEGQVFSWGQGSHGRLGLGTDDNQYVTLEINALSFRISLELLF